MIKVEVFMGKVSPEPNSGCWLWAAHCNKDGYGTMRNDGKKRSAHRVSYQLFRGPIPVGLCVLHKCDVPSCVNPGHLFVGTQADNAADRVAKGRQHDTFGENNGRAKLTEAEVLEILALGSTGITQKKIGAQFNVGSTLINGILSGKIWKHLLPRGRRHE